MKGYNVYICDLFGIGFDRGDVRKGGCIPLPMKNVGRKGAVLIRKTILFKKFDKN